MGNFNKVLSFILGLVVVIVFVIVLSKRLNFQSKIIPFGNNPTPTPTVVQTADKDSKEAAEKKTEIKFTQPEEQNEKQVTSQVKSIPETGPNSLLLLAYGASGALGFYIRRSKK